MNVSTKRKGHVLKYWCLSRVPEKQSAVGRQVRGLLARGKEVSLLDPAHSEDPVVLLVRHRVGAFQHYMRRCRALQATKVANFIFM